MFRIIRYSTIFDESNSMKCITNGKELKLSDKGFNFDKNFKAFESECKKDLYALMESDNKEAEFTN
jgi:hypothetical protein